MKNFNIKLFIYIILCTLIGITFFVCITKPQMHKQFQFNIIDYFIKINQDGSISTQKSITTSVIEEK